MSYTTSTPLLLRLRRQYLSLYPSRLIAAQLAAIPVSNLALARHQPWIVEQMLGGYPSSASTSSTDQVDQQEQGRDRYAPALDYQLGFWKMIVKRLEAELATDEAQHEELELDDWIAERYSELLAVASSPADSSGGIGPSSSYKTYLWGDSEEHLGQDYAAVTLLEAQTTVEAGSTGLRTWTASLYLASVLLLLADEFNQVLTARTASCLGSSGGDDDDDEGHTAYDPVFLDPRPKSILELGSGTGFLSIFLAQWLEQEATRRRRLQESHVKSSGRDVPSRAAPVNVWASDLADQDDENMDEDVPRGETSERVGQLRRTPFATLRENLKINTSRWSHEDVLVEPIAIDWNDADASTASSPERHDRLVRFAREELPRYSVIMAADVIYDPDLIPPLVSCLKLFLEDGAGEHKHGGDVGDRERTRYAIVAGTVRNQTTLDAFVESCATHSLSLIFLNLPSPTTVLEANDGDPIFWNAASAWEGEDVRVMRIMSGGGTH